MCGFPFLIYILLSPGTRGLGATDGRDFTDPLSDLDVALMPRADQRDHFRTKPLAWSTTAI